MFEINKLIDLVKLKFKEIKKIRTDNWWFQHKQR